MTASSRIAVVVLAVAGLAGAGCGGGSDSPEVPVPADIAASITALGGDPADDLEEVAPGRVYRTPKGYLYGYCEDVPDPKALVRDNICYSTER